MHVKPLGQSLVQSKFLIEVSFPVSGEQINENINKTLLTLDTSLPSSFCFKPQNHIHRLFILNQKKVLNLIALQFWIIVSVHTWRGASLLAQIVKNLPATQETQVLSRVGSSSGDGYGNPLQNSCLENSMDRGAWQATVYFPFPLYSPWNRKSPTRLSDFHFHSSSPYF